MLVFYSDKIIMIDCAVALVGNLCARFGQRAEAVFRVARFVGFPQIWATFNIALKVDKIKHKVNVYSG